MGWEDESLRSDTSFSLTHHPNIFNLIVNSVDRRGGSKNCRLDSLHLSQEGQAMILSRGISILALVGLMAVASFLVAENPKEDRAKKLAKLFDALDTTDEKDYAKAKDALGDLVEPRLTPRGEHDLVAARSEGDGEGAPDPAGSSGDERAHRGIRTRVARAGKC